MLLNSGFHLIKDPVYLPLQYNALRPACLEHWKPEQDARQAPVYFPPHAYRKKNMPDARFEPTTYWLGQQTNFKRQPGFEPGTYNLAGKRHY